MPIPETQLSTWSNRGATGISSDAYNSIRHALMRDGSPLSSVTGLDIYLQGSYANATNIYGDSDIDVVVFYPNTFFKDMTALSPAARALHEGTFVPATYHWNHLRDDVLMALRSHYTTPGAVTLGRKSIKVSTGYGTKPADVIPAVQFRRYATFNGRYALTAHWGIQFFDSANSPIINYPKYHLERGEAKNQAARTAGQYKPTVRVFKNLRNYMVDNGELDEGMAPSYFIECALHNVPDTLFCGSYARTVPAILQYLLNARFDSLMCQNGVTQLVGTSPTQWSQESFTAFVVAAEATWRNW